VNNTKELLERLNRGEKLDSPILERLDREGYIKTSDVTNQQTPPGRREFIFISITEKGRKLMQVGSTE